MTIGPSFTGFQYFRLYLAEGGPGGTTSTAGQCDQIAPPIGPYTGARTGGRVSYMHGGNEEEGVRTYMRVISSNLPTSQTSAESGSLVSGPADVAFIGNTMYVLISGAGCSHGVASRDNAIVRMDGTTPRLVANLSQWLRAHPGGQLGPDVEPDGTWYSMIAYNGQLYVMEPNHGLFVRVNPATGAVSLVLDVAKAVGGHIVPTVIARHKGYFYIANLGTFPIMDGTQRVWRYHADTRTLQVVARATAIVGLAFDPRNDAMYILQLTSGAPGPTPGKGSILRLRPGGSPQKIVDGLSMPTALEMGPGGVLYVTNWGFGGPGKVYRIRVP
jgi:hypothetical protein